MLIGVCIAHVVFLLDETQKGVYIFSVGFCVARSDEERAMREP